MPVGFAFHALATQYGFVPAGLSELPRSSGLPELGDIEFVVAGSGHTLRGPANALATAILDNADRL